MFTFVVRRLPTALLCLLAASCQAPNRADPDDRFDDPVEKRSKPVRQARADDYDAAARVELRPGTGSAPMRTGQVFIATVYDSSGRTVRKGRVEWMIEGPGSIIEVGEGGTPSARATKVDSKYAISHTESQERRVKRAGFDFTTGPGQTWCVVSSPVLGETVVTAYVPGISDWDKNRAYSRVTWTEGSARFPSPVTARAGGECTLNTKLAIASESYRIRYRIVDGPPAALFVKSGAPVDDVTEAVAPIGSDGTARIRVTQPVASAGTNRIAIEVMKPKPDAPGEFTVVSKGETRVTWQGAPSNVSISAPKTLAVNQDAMVTYSVSEKSLDVGQATLVATVPRGLNLVRTEPRAVIDGDQLIWTLRAGDRSVQAVFRPATIGPAVLSADLRLSDGTSSRASADVNVAESKLLVKLEGPATMIVGETMTYTIRVTNAGDAPAEKVRVQARLDEGLEITNKTGALDETIPSIDEGQTRTIWIPVAARMAGKLSLEVGAASGSLAAIPQTATVEVKDAQLGITAHGPTKGYIGQDITWQLVVRNTGDVSLGRVVVRATLPPEVTLVKATDGGKLNGRQVTWDLGTAPAQQERTIGVTVACDKPAKKALLRATVSAMLSAGESAGKTVTPDKPAEASIEITGIPALQISVKDSNDPIVVGQRTTYIVRVKNAGTQAATRVELSARVPGQMRAVRATGPNRDGTIKELTETKDAEVQFPALPTLAPNAEATFVIEVEGRFPGDARFRAEAKTPMLSQPVRAEEPTRVMVKESGPVGR